MNVYFDDFTVRQGKTNVVQAVDYYPFGMEATSYTRTASDPTEYLYNGGVEKNDLTGYYETFYRSYDPSIGRFHQIDIKASEFTSVNPYQYAFNDPIALNDPLGDEPLNMHPYVAGTTQRIYEMADGRRSRLAPRGRYDRWNSFFGMSGLSYMLTNAWHATPENGFSYSSYSNGRLVSRYTYDEYVVRGDGDGNGTVLTNDGIIYKYGDGGTGKFIPNENLKERYEEFKNYVASANPAIPIALRALFAIGAEEVLIALGMTGIASSLEKLTIDETDKRWYHYTDAKGWAGVIETGTIYPGSKGKVYLARDAYTVSEAFNNLFLQMPGYEDKGKYVILFTLDYVQESQIIWDAQNPLEYYHYGPVKPARILYDGPNPFGK